MGSDRHIPTPTRRAVLLGAGAVGAAALSGCAAGGVNTGAPTVSATVSKDLGSTSAIPVNGGKIFPDQNVVVTQPVAGTFKAFSATCTHAGCQVNQIDHGLIMCPCHGSEYSITDGSVKRGPAPKALPAATITVNGDAITLG